MRCIFSFSENIQYLQNFERDYSRIILRCIINWKSFWCLHERIKYVERYMCCFMKTTYHSSIIHWVIASDLVLFNEPKQVSHFSSSIQLVNKTNYFFELDLVPKNTCKILENLYLTESSDSITKRTPKYSNRIEHLRLHSWLIPCRAQRLEPLHTCTHSSLNTVLFSLCFFFFLTFTNFNFFTM